MRKIIYRGKVRYNGNHLFQGDWVTGSLIVKPIGTFIYVIEKDELGNIVMDYAVEVMPETIGLYSGQLSRNEKEICEGDILRFEDEQVSVVRWADGGLVVDADFGDYDTTVLGWAIDALGDCEIIGNITDNPELLKPTAK